MREKLRLDVGCGSGQRYGFNPFYEADVFLDIEKPSIKIDNFIIADVCHLPFRNDQFETVYCSHVIEHLENPILGIKELIRTSKKKVIIKTPHRYSVNAKRDPNHKSFFNVSWFRKLLNHLNVFYEINVSWQKRFYLLSMPNEIRIKVRKRIS